MKRTLLTISMVLFVAFLPVLASAAEPAEVESQYPMGQGRMNRGGLKNRAYLGVRMLLGLKDNFELTDEQVTTLEAIKAKVDAGRQAVQTRRNALQEAVKSGAQESAIHAAATELGNAIGDQAVLRVSTKTEIDGLLTDAQKAKLEEVKQQRHNRAKQGRPRRGRGAMDPESAFAGIDTDDDGVISLEEFKTHRERMKERSGGKGTGPRGGMGGRRGRRRPNF